MDSLSKVKELPQCWQDEFEERAAIKEFEGCMAREEAEQQAFELIKERIENDS